MKKENETVVIDLLSYPTSNPMKNMENVKYNLYSIDEVKQVVDNIISNICDETIDIEDFDRFTFDLMSEYEGLKNNLARRIYEALNDLYNPFPEFLHTRRIGLDMYEDSFDILCDLDTPFTEYIITYYAEAYGGVFEIASDEYIEVQDEIIHSVESVIYDVYLECLKALRIEK